MRAKPGSIVVLALVLAGLGLAGCSVLGPKAGPRACAQVYAAVRCQVMLDTAAVKLAVARSDIVSMDVLPDETKGARLAAPEIIVRVALADGSAKDVPMGCFGVSLAPACTDDPHLTARSTIHGGGYYDVPCDGAPPAGCATPVPSADPSAVASAEPLRIDRLDIPIDHVGDYEVTLGEATLPNGLLTDADFAFVDRWPTGVTILEGEGRLQVRALDAGSPPFSSIYEQGWRPGVERVEAFLSFHVDRFDPGAVLSIRDVVVR